MDLSKILSISGRSGLFKVVSQSKNAVIVESLTDSKRSPAFSHERMSSLEEISIFTTGEDRPLKEVLKAFFTTLEGKPATDAKSADKELIKQFGEVVPDYDPDRVYISDIRKMMAWYNLLLSHNMLDFSEEKAEEPAKAEQKEDSESPGIADKTHETAEKPKKKSGAAKKNITE